MLKFEIMLNVGTNLPEVWSYLVSMPPLCSFSVVYGMVPFLNAILGTMLPMLNMAKQDNMKWVFSSGKIIENIWWAAQL